MPPTTPTNIPTGVPPTFTPNPRPVPPVTPPPMPPRPTPPPMPVTPPPSYTPPPQPAHGGHGKEMSVLLGALLVLLIAGGGYYWYSSHMSPAPAAPAQMATTTPAAPAAMATTTAPAAKPTSVPAGFPTNIPVETASLTEAYKLAYPDHGVTQYTASYTSSKTKDELWNLYNNFVAAQAYTVNTKFTSRIQGVLDAKKGNNELNVVVSKQGTSSLVQLTYLERQ